MSLLLLGGSKTLLGGSKGILKEALPFREDSIRLIGDSTASQCSTSAPATTASSSAASYCSHFYWWPMFLARLGYPCTFTCTMNPVDNKRYGSNSGVGGDSMADVAARLPDILATMPEKYLLFSVGTNDINAGTALATLNTRFDTLNTMCLNAGIVPIWTTVTPRNAVDGSSDWGTTGGTTAAQKRLVLCAHNTYRMVKCRELGLMCIDFNAAMSTKAGIAVTGSTVDSLHPSNYGGYLLSEYLYDAINGRFGRGERSMRNALNAYDATYNPYGNILNGAFTITTGGAISNAGGAGAFPLATEVPDSFRLTRQTASTTDVAISIAEENGIDWLTFTFTSYGTGSASEEFRFTYWNGSQEYVPAQVKDELFEASMLLKYIEGTAGVMKSAGFYATSSVAVYKTGTTVSFDAATNRILDSANGFGSFTGDRAILIGGSSSNNGQKKITAAAAGYLQVDPAYPLVDEAAGASVTVCIPQYRVITNNSAMVGLNINTDAYNMVSPVLTIPFNGSTGVARVVMFVNGTVAGTGSVKIALPMWRKLQNKPSALNFLSHDS